MRPLQKIKGVKIFDKAHNNAIQESLTLLLRIERSQLQSFDNISATPRELLPPKKLYAKVNEIKPFGRPLKRWRNYINDLCWKHLGLRPRKMLHVLADSEV